jgi:hypothetical protein
MRVRAGGEENVRLSPTYLGSAPFALQFSPDEDVERSMNSQPARALGSTTDFRKRKL